MRTILLAAAAVSALALPAFADEPKTTTIYAPPGSVAMAVLYPTLTNSQTILAAFTDHPTTATAHRLTASAVLIAIDSPGTCATATASTTPGKDVRHRFCFEESTAPGTAEGVIVVREVAACLMRGRSRERCEGRAPANFKQSAEGTARSVLPEVMTGQAEVRTD